MVARVDPGRVGRAHQALHHFVVVSPWDEGLVLCVAREYALELVERQAPLAGWVAGGWVIGKWEIALELSDALLGDDVPCAAVIAVSGCGDATAFRDAFTGRGLTYALGVRGDASVWPPGMGPLRLSRP